MTKNTLFGVTFKLIQSPSTTNTSINGVELQWEVEWVKLNCLLIHQICGTKIHKHFTGFIPLQLHKRNFNDVVGAASPSTSIQQL